MSDTPPEVATLYRRLLLERSGEERVRMGCEMFDAARALVRASLVAEGPLPTVELRVRVLLRTYGADLPPSLLDRVSEALRAGSGPRTSGLRGKAEAPT